MAEVIIGLEGQTGDVNDLAFSLCEAGMLERGSGKGDARRRDHRPETDGNAQRNRPRNHRIRPDSRRQGRLPLFLAWLYDKWKKAGEKPISVKIENHFYQPDPELLSKAIQEALNKHKKGDR